MTPVLYKSRCDNDELCQHFISLVAEEYFTDF